jgi:hypothetical protein
MIGNRSERFIYWVTRSVLLQSLELIDNYFPFINDYIRGFFEPSFLTKLKLIINFASLGEYSNVKFGPLLFMVCMYCFFAQGKEC